MDIVKSQKEGTTNSVMAGYLAFAMDAFFDVAMPQEKILAWAGLLSESYTLDEVKAAIKSYVIHKGTYKPTLAALMQELETNRQKSREAKKPDFRVLAHKKWMGLLEHIRYQGYYHPPRLDEVTAEALQLAGGWESVCMCNTEKDLPWVKKSFVEEYARIAEDEFDRQHRDSDSPCRDQLPQSPVPEDTVTDPEPALDRPALSFDDGAAARELQRLRQEELAYMRSARES